MNEIVGKVKNESEQNSLREVKLELDEMSDQENEDGMVCAFVNMTCFMNFLVNDGVTIIRSECNRLFLFKGLSTILLFSGI